MISNGRHWRNLKAAKNDCVTTEVSKSCISGRKKPSKKLALKFARSVNSAYLCTAFGKGDSLAQLVEHIPFKDGVLGSSPRRITWYKQHKMKIHTFSSVYLFYFQLFAYMFMAATRLLCGIASSHIPWHTFIGNSYKKVKDPKIIASMSGHIKGSKAFARYRQIDDEIKQSVIELI